jgi:GH35 family endo-1,4-beta-xylanase
MADFTDTQRIEQKLRKANNTLLHMTADVAAARTIKEFVSERRKNLLARFANARIHEGASATAAETEARSNERYVEEFNQLTAEYESAEKVLADWDATRATFEAARSILSLSKESLRQLQG